MNDLISRQAAIDALRNINTIVRPISESDDVFLIDKAEAMTELMMLPSAQPEKRTEKRTETHACDCISRQMLLEYIHGEPVGRFLCDKYNLDGLIEQFPSAQPDIARSIATIIENEKDMRVILTSVNQCKDD